MSTRPAVPSDGDRLGDAIASYLQAIERGESPDKKALLATHPEVATELSAFFARLERTDRTAALPTLSDPNQTSGLDGEVADPIPGMRHFGDYELETELARGGMGIVFRARQRSLNRVIALKMILAGQLASPADVQRFRAEAEAAANLDHPNIVPIYEVGEHDGRQYFTMKLVEGGSLAQSEIIESRTAARLVATVAHAVHFAHQRGILHRDLKPANVLIDRDGIPYVTDFGLAKKTGGDSGLTHTGAVVGTPSYMSPEQARGEKGLTVAADVYSLGAILYELLAGRPPFRSETVYETIKEVIEREPVHPRMVNPKVDADMSAIALKCLAKNPADRYTSAFGMAEDLGRWLAGEPTKARPPSLAGQAFRWLRRNATAAATVIATGIVWGALTGLLLYVADKNHTSNRPIRYLAEGERSFNPTGWAFRVRGFPVARWGIIVGAATLWLGVGWFLRMGIRRRTAAAALGSAAAAGLLAAWVCNLFIAPMLATEIRTQLYPLKTDEPLTWRFDPGGSHFRITQPGFDMPHKDLEYLSQFVPADRRDPTNMESASAYTEVQNDLLQTNRYYRATVGVWLSQFATLLFFLTAGVASGWAADYLSRSGRGLVARSFCYVELYLPTIALLFAASGFVVVLRITAELADAQGPPIGAFAGILGGTAVVSAFAYVGVIRRWHPAMRIGGYLAWVGLVAGLYSTSV